MSREGWIRLLIVGGLIALLEMLCRSGAISRTVIIAPSAMAQSLWQILVSGEFSADILSTMRNVLASSAIAVALGFIGGLILYLLPRLRRTL